MTDPQGWLAIDKPEGVSAGATLARVRRLLGVRKAGHAGTLDPFASGVLPVALNEATKTVGFVVDHHKVYEFTIRFGVETDTLDPTGVAIASSDHRPSGAEITAALPAFTGRIMQRPPEYSAIRINGERAYRLARANRQQELQEGLVARPVVIRAIEIIDRPDPHTLCLRAECGKGVYMRALARDLSRYLGSVGHLLHLRRTRVGCLDISQALRLDPEDPDRLRAGIMPVAAPLADMFRLQFDARAAGDLRMGRSVPALRAFPRPESWPPSGTRMLALHASSPVALAILEDGLVKPDRVLNLQRHPNRQG